MNLTHADVPSQTLGALALSACVIVRPGACSAALKGATEMLSYVQSYSSRLLGFAGSEGKLKSPLTMRQSDSPPNFWEREHADKSYRLENMIKSFIPQMQTPFDTAGHKE